MRSVKAMVAVSVAAASVVSSAAFGGIELVGKGSLAATATDLSGLKNILEDGVTPHNLLGGLGSGIAYTGVGDTYVLTPDRGPADGATTYIDRMQFVTLTLSGGAVTPKLVDTTLLVNESNQLLTGSSAAVNAANPTAALRFDPEGVRVGRNGNYFISDEYGPYVYEFDKTGKRVRALNVPAKFLIANPSGDAVTELPPGNTSGRQSNRGMEGLAISPDGSKLYGIMQSPLIQDGGLDADNKRVGLNTRILEIDVATGTTKEYVYQLDAKGYGISEILAIGGGELLVLERDGKVGAAAEFKQVFKINLTGATDVSAVATLPVTGKLDGVTVVGKSAFLDLLDPSFGLAGETFPEKIEGLAFGPDLADGRRLLYVVNDNDFKQDVNTNFYAFAIDRSDLPSFEAQQFGNTVAIPLPPAALGAVPVLGGMLWGAVARRKQ